MRRAILHWAVHRGREFSTILRRQRIPKRSGSKHAATYGRWRICSKNIWFLCEWCWRCVWPQGSCDISSQRPCPIIVSFSAVETGSDDGNGLWSKWLFRTTIWYNCCKSFPLFFPLRKNEQWWKYASFGINAPFSADNGDYTHLLTQMRIWETASSPASATRSSSRNGFRYDYFFNPLSSLVP